MDRNRHIEKAIELVLQRFTDELKIFAPEFTEKIFQFVHGVVRSKNIKHILYGEQEGYCNGWIISPFMD